MKHFVTKAQLLELINAHHDDTQYVAEDFDSILAIDIPISARTWKVAANTLPTITPTTVGPPMQTQTPIKIMPLEDEHWRSH